jgi:hypothetical protein
MDALYRTRKSIPLGEDVVWLRVLSDFDLQARSEYSVLAMVRRRREIDDPKSRAHELYIVGLENAPDDELRGVILLAAQNDLQRDAVRTIRPNYFPPPDNPTDDEKVEIVKKREEDAARVIAEVEKFVREGLDKTEAEIKDWQHDKLLPLAKMRQLEQQARLVEIRAFQDYTVFAAYYRDEACKTPLFAAPEEVSQAAPEVRGYLVGEYFKFDRITQLDLQNLFTTGDSKESVQPGSSPEVPSHKSSASKPRGKSRGT